jgi:hypothetical protein
MIVSNNSPTEWWRLQGGYVIHVGLLFSDRKHFFLATRKMEIKSPVNFHS